MNQGWQNTSRFRNGPKPEEDKINHPEHYTKGGIECIEFIESWGMGYEQGNIIKYVTRYPYKGDAINDLRKAKWYIERLIEQERAKLLKKELPEEPWMRDPVEVEQYLNGLRELHVEPNRPWRGILETMAVHSDEEGWNPKPCSICGDAYFCDGPEAHINKDVVDPPQFAQGAICDDPCYREFCEFCVNLEPMIYTGDGRTIKTVHDLMDLIDSRELRRNAEQAYPPGHPFCYGQSPNPCKNSDCICTDKAADEDRDFRSTGVSSPCPLCMCDDLLCSCMEDARDILNESRRSRDEDDFSLDGKWGA